MSESIYKTFLWLGVAVLLVFTPVVRGAVSVWSIALVMFVIFFLVFIWLLKLNNTRDYKFKHTRLDLTFVFFIVLALISFVFSIYRYASFFALLRLFSYIGLYYLVVNNFDYIMRRRLIWLVICMGGVLSVYGLLQYFNILPHSWWKPQKFLSATYVNHNHFSGYLELVIPLSAMVMLERNRVTSVMRVIAWMAFLSMIMAFIFAQSRGAWICLALSLFVMSVILLRQKVINKKTVIALALLLISIFSFFYFTKLEIIERVGTITANHFEEASLQNRLMVWHGTVAMIKDRPLIGTGIGTFVWGFPRFSPVDLNWVRVYFAHNDYLQVMAEMGILAGVVMIYILGIVIKVGLRRKAYDFDIFGCTIGVLALALHGLVDFNFHITANMLLFIVFAAFIVGQSDQKQE